MPTSLGDGGPREPSRRRYAPVIPPVKPPDQQRTESTPRLVELAEARREPRREVLLSSNRVEPAAVIANGQRVELERPDRFGERLRRCGRGERRAGRNGRAGEWHAGPQLDTCWLEFIERESPLHFAFRGRQHSPQRAALLLGLFGELRQVRERMLKSISRFREADLADGGVGACLAEVKHTSLAAERECFQPLSTQRLYERWRAEARDATDHHQSDVALVCVEQL